MTFNVYLQGGDGGAERFGIDPARYLRMEINAVNRAARWARRVLLIEPMAKATGIRKVILGDRIALRVATTTVPAASIVPASHGIPARCYRHRAEAVDGSGTRARIVVDWWQGEKIGAGFINPASKRRLPLATRSVRERKLKKPARLNPHIKQYRYEYAVPRDALGPSAAALMQVVVDDRVHEQVAEKVAEEFNLELDKELL